MNSNSELSQIITAQVFEMAYKTFMEQADKNSLSNKAEGSKAPYGFDKKPKCDGAYFGPKYGQGAASSSPYMNWWVVSIYYLPTTSNILIGIEVDRYSHLNDMEIRPIRYEYIGNKKKKVAVFFSVTKSQLNYQELYIRFISVCDEVLRLGLN